MDAIPEVALVLFGVAMSVAWVYEFGVQIISHIVEKRVGKWVGGWFRSTFSLERAAERTEVDVNGGGDD